MNIKERAGLKNVALRRVVLFLIGISTLAGCHSYYPAATTSTGIRTAMTGEEDGSVEAIISPYRDRLSEAMTEVVAELSTDLVKEQPECTLGNHVASVMLQVAESESGRDIDFSVMNYGGLRVDIVGAGPLTVEDAYQISPFENFIVILDLEGTVVRSMLQKIAGYGGWPVQDISYRIDDGKAEDILVGGEPLEDGRNYSMAVVDYVANGGDNMSMLKGIPFETTGVLLREGLLMSWRRSAAEGLKISAVKDGRVQLK